MVKHGIGKLDLLLKQGAAELFHVVLVGSWGIHHARTRHSPRHVADSTHGAQRSCEPDGVVLQLQQQLLCVALPWALID